MKKVLICLIVALFASCSAHSNKVSENSLEFTPIEISPVEVLFYTELGNGTKLLDWLNSHHFDYRGLIEKGLALKVPEEMYKS